MTAASPARIKAVEATKAKRRDAQEKVINLLGEGLDYEAAMKAVGRTRNCYYLWKDRYNDFARRASDAEARFKERVESGVPDSDLDFDNFRLRYFKMRSFWHMKSMIQAIDQSPGGSFIMILLPPEWGKTTLIEDYICYKLALDPDFRCVHISQSQGHARKVVGRIQRRMLDTESPYVQKFGPFKSDERIETKPWNAGFFTVARSTHDERDYSLEAKGAGSQIQGARAEIIFLDDIQSRNTLNLTPKLLDYIRQEIITRPGKTGKVVMVGTRVEFHDIYEAILNEDIVDKLVKIPAIDPETKQSNFPPAFDADGHPILDEKGNQLGWSLEDLAKRHGKVGDTIWDRTYLQQPESTMGPPFPEEVLRNSLDFSRGLGPQYVTAGRIAGVDPALGGVAAFVVCGYDSLRLHVLDVLGISGLSTYDQLFAQIEQWSQRYNPESWSIETESFQKGLVNDKRVLDLAERYGFSPIPHITHGRKFDAVIGVASMAGAFARGEIRLPYGDEHARQETDKLLTELRNWRPDVPTKMLKQDRVMALWFTYVRWTQIRANIMASQDMWKRAGLYDYVGAF
jgi:hypothetical protein